MYTRILVPVDGSDASEFGLLEAARLARLGGGTLRLLHVIDDLPGSAESLAYGDWPSERAQAALDHGHELLRRGAARAQALGARTETVLVEGRGRRLHEYVGEQVAGWPAELVVIGTHGRRGVQRLVLGSDAEDVVRHSDVPVLLVRHETPASKQAAGAADRAVACRRCQSPNDAAARFCGQCGGSLEPKSCRSCNSLASPDDRFCGQCGARLA